MFKLAVILAVLAVAYAAETDKKYDLTTETVPYQKASYDTWFVDASYGYCRGVEYSTTFQMCCNGVIVDKEFKTVTENGNTYVVETKICCGTNVAAVDRTYEDGNHMNETGMCCGNTYVGQVYDGSKVCCGGSYIDNKDTSTESYGCCEGTYAKNAWNDAICCSGEYFNNTASALACCPSEVTIMNDGYGVGDNTGFSGEGYSLGYPAKVSAGSTYNTASEWCCKGKVISKLDSNGEGFFNNTDVKTFTCCGGIATSYNPKTQFTCGSWAYNDGCTIYDKALTTPQKACTADDQSGEVCLASHIGSYYFPSCSQRQGKGVGYAPQSETAWTTAFGSKVGGDKSGAATAVVSLAALAGVAAFFF